MPFFEWLFYYTGGIALCLAAIYCIIFIIFEGLFQLMKNVIFGKKVFYEAVTIVNKKRREKKEKK